MKRSFYTLTLAAVLLLTQYAFCGTYGGGQGTPEDPYQIAEPNHLLDLGFTYTDWDKHFILTEKINMPVLTGDSFRPIGYFDLLAFTGVFDGNGHTISNLTINYSELVYHGDHFALFAYVGSEGQIIDLGVTDVNIEQGGGLVGVNDGTITNCYITGNIIDGGGGLVGNNRGTITNCYADCIISGYSYTGGLVGTNSGTIANCYAAGDVVGHREVSDYIGGLAGINSGGITDSYATGNVTGDDWLGGLVGDNSEGAIINCYATGNVNGGSGSKRVGGLVGYNYYDGLAGGGWGQNYDGVIISCYAAGSVTGRLSVGGLVGENNSGTIILCYAAGSVIGEDCVGGLVGNNSAGAITNCYGTGPVSGVDSVGGIVGSNSNYPIITNCYTVSKVTGTENVGGVSGFDDTGSYAANFWNIDINPFLTGVGSGSTGGTKAKTTLEMQTQSTYTNKGWDFVGEDVNGTEDFWYMPGCGYPVLSWQSIGIIPDVTGLYEDEAVDAIRSAGPIVITETTHSKTVPVGNVISQYPPAGCETAVVTISVSDGHPYQTGSGTEADPFQIWTSEQMNEIGLNPGDWDKQFVLMTDIDLYEYPSESFNTIGDRINRFAGVFDGNGHTVSNLSYASSIYHRNIGLFGYVGTVGKIRDLKLSDVYIQILEGFYAGGMVGENYGDITNCYADGSISGDHYVGGLVGINHGSMTDCDAVCTVNGDGGLVGSNTGTMTNCSASGSVNANVWCAGGLAGSNSGTITNCYATSSVMGPWNGYAGGLVGSNIGTITNCYATGDVIGRGAGGLVGRNENGSLTNCYFSGSVGASFDGGFTGYDKNGSYDSCFWDSEVNSYCVGVENIDDPNEVMGRTTLEMQTQSTYTDHGWDFVDEDVNGTDDTWRLCVDGVSYPKLAWEHDRFGDFLCPDVVAVEDLEYFADHWLSTDERADLNHDGSITFADFAIFAENWMQGI